MTETMQNGTAADITFHLASFPLLFHVWTKRNLLAGCQYNDPGKNSKNLFRWFSPDVPTCKWGYANNIDDYL